MKNTVIAVMVLCSAFAYAGSRTKVKILNFQDSPVTANYAAASGLYCNQYGCTGRSRGESSQEFTNHAYLLELPNGTRIAVGCGWQTAGFGAYKHLRACLAPPDGLTELEMENTGDFAPGVKGVKLFWSDPLNPSKELSEKYGIQKVFAPAQAPSLPPISGLNDKR